ncbi:hypothetical protein [Sideroxydans sp. CL21]|nr:hypothetical protein [Sideroxydans sp. CL21]
MATKKKYHFRMLGNDGFDERIYGIKKALAIFTQGLSSIHHPSIDVVRA